MNPILLGLCICAHMYYTFLKCTHVYMYMHVHFQFTLLTNVD